MLFVFNRDNQTAEPISACKVCGNVCVLLRSWNISAVYFFNKKESLFVFIKVLLANISVFLHFPLLHFHSLALIVTFSKDENESEKEKNEEETGELLFWLALCGLWHKVSRNVPLDRSSKLSVKQLNETHVKRLYISISAYFGPSTACGSRADCDS